MPITTIRPSVDAWTDQQKPNTNRPRSPGLRLQSTASGAGKRAYIFFAPPFVPGSGQRVHLAELQVWLANEWSGSHTITAKRITAPWQEGQITWNNAPSVSDTNAAQVTVSNQDVGSYAKLDLTDMLADVAAGAEFYGVRLEIGRDANRRIWSSEAPDARDRPALLVVHAPPLEPVTLTAPTGGQAVGVESPTLTWQVNSPDDEFTQTHSQVQIATSEDGFGSPAYDSGEQANTEGQWSLEGEFTLTEHVPCFWRARVKGDDGEWTEWSDVQETVYVPKGTLVIDSPPKVVTLRNSVRDPHATGTTWWTSGGAHPLSHVDDDSDDGLGGCVQVSRSAAGTEFNLYAVKSLIASSENGYLAVEPGDQVLAIGSVKPVSIDGGNFTMTNIVVDWLDAANSLVATSRTSNTSPEIDRWDRFAVTAVAPANAAWARLRMALTHTNTDTAAGRADRALLAKIPEGVEIDPDPNLLFSGSGYVDDNGNWREDDTGEEVEWTGEPNASESVRYDRYVEDITPLYVWTYTPAGDDPDLEQKQWSVRVEALEADWGDLTPFWETGWRTGPETQFRHSQDFPLVGLPPALPWPYRVTVRARDGIDRAATPGDPPWVEASREFRYQRSGAIDPPTVLTVTSDGPAVILEWEETEAADEFAITRDGEYVRWSVLPEETRVQGNKHRLRLYHAVPGREHTWGVERVVHTNHPVEGWFISEHSEPATATHELAATATWLVDPDDETVVEIFDVEGRQAALTRELHEVSEVHETRAGELVQITDAVGRWKGRVDGQLIKPEDSNALVELRRRAKPLRLVGADTNALVEISGVKHEQANVPNNTVWDVGFSWVEVREEGAA